MERCGPVSNLSADTQPPTRDQPCGRRLKSKRAPLLVERVVNICSGAALLCGPFQRCESHHKNHGARLVRAGNSVTTDHISPAGAIAVDSPVAKYLEGNGVEGDFNSYGSRRGNDRVMTRGTFANIRLRNELLQAPRVVGQFILVPPVMAQSRAR